MPSAKRYLNLPPSRADKGRYVMRVTFAPLPSPLMGEGSGGGKDSTSSPPHPYLPPPRGEGVLTYPCQPVEGGELYPWVRT
jgi:hypothetical protein